MIIYTEKMEEFLRKEKYTYFPRKIKKSDHLKLYKKYYSAISDTCFKVIQIYYTGGIEYYSIKELGTLLFAEISYPYESEYLYELLTDRKNIIKIPNIVNTNISYSGAEIKLWFLYQRDNNNLDKYSKFISFIDKNSKSVICDEKYYFLYGKESDKGIYYDCKVSVDISNNKRRK